MRDDCLMKLKPLVSDVVYQKLKAAADAGDQKAWDFTMMESHADMRYMKHRAILTANRRDALVKYVAKRQAEGIKPSESLVDLLSGSGAHQGSGVVSVDRYIQAVRAEFSAMNIEFIDATRPTMMGLRRAGNPEFIEGIVKGIFGDAGASVSKGGQAIIDAWTRTLKAIAARYNAAGGALQEMADYALPVNHYSPAMIKAGREQWVEDAKRLFNIRRKFDAPDISDDEIIDRAFTAITEEGADLTFGKGLETKRGKGQSTYSSHEMFRTLQPKNGEAWLEYTRKYGAHTNPIDAMKEYIAGMAKEIGLLETLGPAYRETMEIMVEEARRVEKNRHAGSLALKTFDHISSKMPRPDDAVSNTLRGLRALQTITKLPMSGITALTDVSFAATRSLYLGMNPVKVFTRQMQNLITSRDYKTAGRMALFLDYANSVAAASNRYSESLGGSWLDRVADFAMRANGLNHWTNSGKATFALEMLSFMANNAAAGADKLPKGLRMAFERYGISDADWAVIKKAVIQEQGVDMIDPTLVDGPLRSRLIGMIIEETSYAVPEPNAKVRAIMSMGTPKNTVWHEAASTLTQFKTFGATILTSQLGMLLDQAVPVPTKLKYMTTLLTTSTVMGGLVLQLRDIAKGRTPRDMDDPKFAWDAAMQGGFLGVAGDLFFSDPDLFGGLPGFIAGPTVSDLNRIKKVMFGTYDEVMKEGGDWAKVLFPAAEQAAEELAFPLKLWQTRVAVERLMLDDVRRLTDPDYYNKLRRTRDWMKEEKGQQYWSTPK